MATAEERLKAIEEKQKKLQAQKNAIISREREKERKQRTRRLIEKGAVLESVFDCENLSVEDTKIFLEKLKALPNSTDFLKEEKKKTIPKAPPKEKE